MWNNYLKCFGFLRINWNCHHLLKPEHVHDNASLIVTSDHQPWAEYSQLFTVQGSWRAKLAGFAKLPLSADSTRAPPWLAELFQSVLGCLILSPEVTRSPNVTCSEIGTNVLSSDCPNHVICSFLSPGNIKIFFFFFFFSVTQLFRTCWVITAVFCQRKAMCEKAVKCLTNFVDYYKDPYLVLIESSIFRSWQKWPINLPVGWQRLVYTMDNL